MSQEIIIASDSHGRSDLLQKLEEAYPHADLFLHCGDLEDNPGQFHNWVFVRGNNDWTGEMPDSRRLTVGGHHIFMTHSDHFRYSNREAALAQQAKKEGCDIALYGHTHCSAIEEVNGVLEINPGSLWLPRDGNLPSYARLILSDDGKAEAEIIFQDAWPFDPSKPRKERKKRWFWQ